MEQATEVVSGFVIAALPALIIVSVVAGVLFIKKRKELEQSTAELHEAYRGIQRAVAEFFQNRLTRYRVELGIPIPEVEISEDTEIVDQLVKFDEAIIAGLTAMYIQTVALLDLDLPDNATQLERYMEECMAMLRMGANLERSVQKAIAELVVESLKLGHREHTLAMQWIREA